MKKMTEILVDPKGRRYYFARLTFAEIKLSPYIYKKPHQAMVDKLKADLRERWVLQPVTCYEEDGTIYLADGKHRYQACMEHDRDLEEED